MYHQLLLPVLQQMQPPTLRLSSVDGQLLANGKPFRIKGVTWWGAESAGALPGGLAADAFSVAD